MSTTDDAAADRNDALLCTLQLSKEGQDTVRIVVSSSKVKEEKVSSSTINAILNDLNRGELTIANLAWLRKETNIEPSALSVILSQSRLRFPAFEEPEHKLTKEQVARREFLVRRDEERQYGDMVKGLGAIVSQRTGELQYTDQADDNNQISSANELAIHLNMVVAIVVSYGIGYYCGSYWSGLESFRMVCGVLGATVAMVVEMVLFILRASRLDSKAGGASMSKRS